MWNLYENAVQSIRIGVEDYHERDPARALSAARNLYAGLLLLAKEVLVRAAPNATERDVIAAGYVPAPDGAGGVRFIPESKRTIDFTQIGDRFKRFGLAIDVKALRELNRIRNEIEHRYPNVSHDVVREALATAFPVAVQLFRMVREEPANVLGDAWDRMLEVRGVFEQERRQCHTSFAMVNWRTGILENATPSCPECQSELVAQENPDNTEQHHASARCRCCGLRIPAEALIENAVNEFFKESIYIARTDGGNEPVWECPECARSMYIVTEEYTGCAWCDFVLDGSCLRCGTTLIPGDVDANDYRLCSYCGYMTAKDDY